MTPVTDKTDSVRENLIAARALIDTPEKFARTSAFMAVVNGGNNAAWLALGQAVPTDFVGDEAKEGFTRQYQYTSHPSTTHADILALFDRAIASRRVSP